MKDKIKPIKPVDDNTSIIQLHPTQQVRMNWNTCIVCGLDLSKKGKTRIIKGVKYVSIEHKKYFKLWDKQICWNCVFNLVKKFKNEGKE